MIPKFNFLNAFERPESCQDFQKKMRTGDFLCHLFFQNILNILSHLRTMCDSAEFFFVFLMPNGKVGSGVVPLYCWLIHNGVKGLLHLNFLNPQFHEHCGKEMVEVEIIHWTLRELGFRS